MRASPVTRAPLPLGLLITLKEIPSDYGVPVEPPLQVCEFKPARPRLAAMENGMYPNDQR